MTDDDEELKMMTGILQQRKCCVYTVPLTQVRVFSLAGLLIETEDRLRSRVSADFSCIHLVSV